MYSVEELKNKLKDKVTGLGIDPKFKENPAFDEAIIEIKCFITRMNMGEALESVKVKEEKRSISFSWTSPAGNKYSMMISCSSPETFRCIKTEERPPFVGTNGQVVREKEVTEQVTTIDNSSGFITIYINGSSINNIDCKNGECNNNPWSVMEYYTSEGIMRDRDLKIFPGGILAEDFDSARTNSILFIPRQAFIISGPFYNSYEMRSILSREKLDTARLTAEDKPRGIEYRATVRLSQEHGLQNMQTLGGDPYPQRITIPPLSTEEIDRMISR